MKIIINESEDLCVEELMILYLLHNRSDEEVDLMTDNIIENYFDEDRANKAGILELRNIQVQDIPDKELSDLTEKFRDIFRGKKGGKISTIGAVKMKLNEFKEEYDYTDQEILEATQNYVNVEAKNNYEYLQRADRFIFTEENGMKVSKLAAYCDELDDTEEEWKDEVV